MSTQQNTADFPFTSQYVEVKGSKMHYIEDGQGDPVLFLHGNPTSSYLWRNIIPHLSDRARCIAPDLIGMGKSDKPEGVHGFANTYAYLEAFIEKMGLENITLVIHDWGSALGFHYAHKHPEKIKGIAFMEAVYKLLDWEALPKSVKTGMSLMRIPFFNWLLVGVRNAFIEGMLPRATFRELTEEEMAYYRTPYPTIKSRKPLRVWPQEIPKNGKPEQNHKKIQAYHEWLKTTEIPKLCLYAEPGIMIQREDAEWIESHFPNTKTVSIGAGLHFVQEDNPENIGMALRSWYETI